MGLDGKTSYQNWAIYLHEVIHKIVSPVGVWKRVTGKWSKFLWLVLQCSLKLQLGDTAGKKKCSLFRGFKRVLLQDSTSIQLPLCVRKFFPGNHSRGKQRAGAKIQAVYDIQTGEEINLLKLLRKKTHIDLWVVAGDKEQVRMRLVAVKLPQEVAGERKRKAAKDRDK